MAAGIDLSSLPLPTLESVRAEITRRTRMRGYRDDPQAFVHDAFTWGAGEGPMEYQDEILGEFVPRRRASIRAPHGVGKTTPASWLVIWFACTRDAQPDIDDWKVVTTASAWRQLSKYLWPEIHKWVRRLRWDVIGREPFNLRTELLTLSLKLRTGEAFAVASDQPDLIEGAHAEHILYVLDEAKAIPPKTFDAAEGALMTRNAYALAISTPGEPNGRFYEIQSRKAGYEDWWTRHVTLAEAIRAFEISGGRVGIDPEKAAQRKRQWGETSAVYQNRVLGNFAASAEDSVIPLAWIEAAIERWREWHDSDPVVEQLTRVGADIGRGGDQTVFALRAGPVVTELRRYDERDTMPVAGRLLGLEQRTGGVPVVDVIGIGAGVYDRLREQQSKARAFTASAHTEAKDRTGEMGFADLRSAAWWNMREILDPGHGSIIALPPDDLLTGDLTAPRWKVMSGAKIQVESKDTIRERIGRSTDSGDAVIQAFADHLLAPVRTGPLVW